MRPSEVLGLPMGQGMALAGLRGASGGLSGGRNRRHGTSLGSPGNPTTTTRGDHHDHSLPRLARRRQPA